MDVVVVESPAKAKTINKYLGRNYRVLASYGHVRDLPPRDGSVRPEQDFEMDWEVDARAKKHLDAIAKAVREADHLYLATDPDREGEAISWHVYQVLGERKALDGVDVKRIVFHEVTKDAVLEALAHPRPLHRELVEAYLARRALDYLVGFTLSPVLWRKLPGARSAGRVQSVALRLVCEREAEIEVFRPREYWSVEAEFATAADKTLTARLTHLDGAKLDQFDLPDETAATRAVAAIEAREFRVSGVEKKTVTRRPQPPFTTSTLQQEASRKLGFGATRTMRTAQKLYEGVELGGETVGLITYMRTDSINMAGEAVRAARALAERLYGPRYVPDQPHVWRNRAKNAQEAHEAIRPTDMTRRPEEVARYLDEDGRRLYELIWKRAMASAMAGAVLEQVAVDIASTDRQVILRATGSVMLFDGFLTLYQEGRDDESEDESGRILPAVDEGEALRREAVRPEQHFTKPPPRYTEASLVKRLEELGIGRPSTYASILSVLQERDYVRLESRRFVPDARGRVVTAFLVNFFQRYVQYNFTAELEDRLDDISNGAVDWKAVLQEFWTAFSAAVEETSGLTITQVLDALDEDLGPHFFRGDGPDSDARACPACGAGRLGLKLGKHGAFIGCSNYPECGYTRPLTVEPDEDEAAPLAGPRSLGLDPETGLEVTLRKGPYGLYVQLGEPEGKQKPKRASLLKGMDPATLDLETALALLSLPREIGPHPEDGEPILAGVGRFGPYLKHGARYVSLPKDDDVLSIGLNRAVTVLAEAPKKKPASEPLRALGDHPSDGKPVALYRGRFGPYVRHGKTFASLPKGEEPETLTLERAVELLAAKSARGGAKNGKGRGRKAAGARTAKQPATADAGR